MAQPILKIAEDKGMAGVGLTVIEATELTQLPDTALFDILRVTQRIREHHKGMEVNLCSIVNAKSGLCAEDCTFCAQSVKYDTGVETYPMKEAQALVDAALDAESAGAREFSIVTSGTGIGKEKDLDTLEAALGAMKQSSGLERCASLGIMTREVLERLKNAGLESYHHNLETARSFFPNICTTHEYDDDVQTVRLAKEAGFYVCSGGLFGLGEGWEHRVELAATLAELDVDSVPINFLNPRSGTPLEDGSGLTPRECLRIIALFRLMLPLKDIVVCGGRPTNLRDLQSLIFAAGANGVMVGNYLTTPGRDRDEDLQMIRDLGLKPRK